VGTKIRLFLDTITIPANKTEDFCGEDFALSDILTKFAADRRHEENDEPKEYKNDTVDTMPESPVADRML
jgi:hypothetical protein